jgi:aspartate kinase
MSVVVMKFGGTSLDGPERIRSVAKRVAKVYEAGITPVIVVSAMGKTTDDLIHLATQVSPKPPHREMDMLLTTGERVSMALLAMALSDFKVLGKRGLKKY